MIYKFFFSNSSSGDIKPEEIPIVDAQYPLLNQEQQKKVTSCSTCGVSFSLIAEKLLHYTENLTCMKVITEKYKFFQVRIFTINIQLTITRFK